LKNKGSHVVANNLPGHGTTVDDCNRYKYINWIDYTQTNFAKLASECEHLFVIGCSMGAVLGLYLASVFPINGLIIGGTVIQFKNWFSVNYINPFLCKFIKKTQKKTNYSKEVLKRIKFYGYDKYPLVALNEFRNLIKFMVPRYKNIQCPTLIFHSKKDNLSDYQNVKFINTHINSKEKKIITLNQAHHNLFDKNPDIDFIYKQINKFVTSQ